MYSTHTYMYTETFILDVVNCCPALLLLIQIQIK